MSMHRSSEWCLPLMPYKTSRCCTSADLALQCSNCTSTLYLG